jgi:hypothetical protein
MEVPETLTLLVKVRFLYPPPNREQSANVEDTKSRPMTQYRVSVIW